MLCVFFAGCRVVLCFDTGFLGFLHLLCSHPWSATPLLVDPSGEVRQEGRRALQVRTSLSSNRVLLLHLSRWCV